MVKERRVDLLCDVIVTSCWIGEEAISGPLSLFHWPPTTSRISMHHRIPLVSLSYRSSGEGQYGSFHEGLPERCISSLLICGARHDGLDAFLTPIRYLEETKRMPTW